MKLKKITVFLGDRRLVEYGVAAEEVDKFNRAARSIFRSYFTFECPSRAKSATFYFKYVTGYHIEPCDCGECPGCES